MAAYLVEPGDSPHVYSDGTDVRRISSSVAMAAVAKTADYVLTSADHGRTFTNEGAGGTVEFELPAWEAGFWARFVVVAAETLRVTDAVTGNIYKGSLTASHWSSATPQTSITIEAAATGGWTVTSVVNNADWV